MAEDTSVSRVPDIKQYRSLAREFSFVESEKREAIEQEYARKVGNPPPTLVSHFETYGIWYLLGIIAGIIGWSNREAICDFVGEMVLQSTETYYLTQFMQDPNYYDFVSERLQNTGLSHIPA